MNRKGPAEHVVNSLIDSLLDLLYCLIHWESGCFIDQKIESLIDLLAFLKVETDWPTLPFVARDYTIGHDKELVCTKSFALEGARKTAKALPIRRCSGNVEITFRFANGQLEQGARRTSFCVPCASDARDPSRPHSANPLVETDWPTIPILARDHTIGRYNELVFTKSFALEGAKKAAKALPIRWCSGNVAITFRLKTDNGSRA